MGDGAELIGRRRLLGLGAAVLAVAVTGCGDDDDDAGDTGTDEGGEGGGENGGAGNGGASDASPRGVEHRYGTTEVPADPQRVVTIGMIDHDAVLALGVVPIAVTANEYSADQPFGVWPWAQDELGDAEPVVLSETEINYEQIAELAPDLILAVYTGISEEQYGLLTEIAPTVGPSGDHEDYQTPWFEMTRTIGRALGREDEAEAAVQSVEDLFATQREAHPEFGGLTAVYAGFLEAGQYYAETEGSTRAAILAELGFDIAEVPGAEGFFAEVSSEQVAEQFDHDVILWELGDPALEAEIHDDPVYEQLPAAQEGRDVFVTDLDVAGGLALISVLSLPFVIEALVPQLAAAVDGDPATTADA